MSDIIERLHGPDGMEAGSEILRLREENARLREAVGLMTTMAPFMELDVNDPVGTAKTVWAEQEKLFQENARLWAALKPFAMAAYSDADSTLDLLHAICSLTFDDFRRARAAIRENDK